MRVPASAPRAGTRVIRHSAVIPFPLEKVWGLVIKPERMAEWNTEISEVLDIAGPMDRIGGGYRQIWRLAGRRMVSPGLWAGHRGGAAPVP